MLGKELHEIKEEGDEEDPLTTLRLFNFFDDGGLNGGCLYDKMRWTAIEDSGIHFNFLKSLIMRLKLLIKTQKLSKAFSS